MTEEQSMQCPVCHGYNTRRVMSFKWFYCNECNVQFESMEELNAARN